MTPEIYNIDNYVFSLILIAGGTSTYLLRKFTGTLPSRSLPEDDDSSPSLRRTPIRRDGRMLIVLGLIFLPLSFLYAYFIKQPQVDRQKAPATLQTLPSEPQTP